ncbi:tautomerase family protein [Pseudomonas segetis]|uniref:Tautomerase enzyme n=1 Tax=Pseudomonas segetis TaxID=298908 RepID=A0A239HSJ2_9PSED|nr:tautomerase family protein [Pseudomonas segetis]SNS84038.1 Tautomerase enzyme [Pseudomonas segetis]
MPLIQVNLLSKPPHFIKELGENLHQSLMATWGIPIDDCFQIFHQKQEHELNINPLIFGGGRSKDVIALHITSTPRTQKMKLDFYQDLATRLEQKMNIRPQDIFISIVENTREDWSFGSGKAQLLTD